MFFFMNIPGDLQYAYTHQNQHGSEKLVVCRCSSQSLREFRWVHFLYSTVHLLYSTISVESVEGLDFFPEKYTDLPKTGHNRNLQTKMSIPRKNFMKTLLIQSNQSVNLPSLKLTDIAHENPHLSW